MKRFLIGLLSALGLCACACAFVSCDIDNTKYEVKVEGYTLQIEADGSYSIIRIPEEILENSKWEVPEEIGGYPISRLGSYERERAWFVEGITLHDLGNVRWLTLPDCIQSICVKDLSLIKVMETEVPLSEISFREGYADRENAYFLSPYEETQNWRYVTEENIVDNMLIVKDIAGESAVLAAAFGGGLLEIPDEYDGVPITTLGRQALYGEAFEVVRLGANITKIEEYACFGLPIEQFDFVEGLTSVGDCAFCNTRLTAVTLPSTLTFLGYGVFSGSTLQSFDFSNVSIAWIPAITFRDCPLTGELKFPNGVKSIGQYTFCGAEFEEIALPDSIEVIQASAFKSCNKLTEFRVPDKVTSFSMSAVADCNELRIIHLNGIQEYEVGFPTGEQALKSLKEFTVAENNAYFMVENGILYSKNKSVLYKCPAALQIKSLLIESGRVEQYAFYENKYIEEVFFAKGCEEIGYSSFENCTALQSVQLSDAIGKIPLRAFYGCQVLTSVNTGKVETFESECFAFCLSLQQVDFTACRTIGGQAFFECDLHSVTLGANCQSVAYLAFGNNSNLTSFKGNGIATMHEQAFLNTPVYEKLQKKESNKLRQIMLAFLRVFIPFI